MPYKQLFSDKDDIAMRKQAHRNDFMRIVADHPEFNVEDFTHRADHWWPGTVESDAERGT